VRRARQLIARSGAPRRDKLTGTTAEEDPNADY